MKAIEQYFHYDVQGCYNFAVRLSIKLVLFLFAHHAATHYLKYAIFELFQRFLIINFIAVFFYIVIMSISSPQFVQA